MNKAHASAPTSITHKYGNTDVEYVRKDTIPAAIPERREGPWVIGKKYMIRTVTMINIGRLVYADDKEFVLDGASWIADTGRFHNALANGSLNEIEPFVSEVIIGRSAIVDATEWLHDLPRVQK